MLSLELLILILIIPINHSEINTQTKISVLLSRIEAFSGYDSENQLPNKLVAKIMDNFGKKFNFNIECVITNQTLNEFENEQYSENQSKS